MGGPMAAASRKPGLRRPSSSRRIVVVVVPPVDELDLVGPLQVFNSVNRLAGRTAYTIEVVTNADRLTVEGEGGVLSFVARHNFRRVEGACDSVLLVCGMGSRSVRDAALSAWLKRMAAEVRRLFPADMTQQKWKLMDVLKSVFENLIPAEPARTRL